MEGVEFNMYSLVRRLSSVVLLLNTSLDTNPTVNCYSGNMWASPVLLRHITIVYKSLLSTTEIAVEHATLSFLRTLTLLEDTPMRCLVKGCVVQGEAIY